MARAAICRQRILTGLLLWTCAVAAPAADVPAVSGDMQKAVRSLTFEVVVPKATSDPLTYEKPLPLELVPFLERNDAYWSIGTAFALGANRFVTAAHVVVPTFDGQYGAASLRDAEGRIYAIDSVLKFSLHEDFVVFSVREPPGITPPVVSRSPRIDEPVFAVGNALGEGVIIRGGLLTSETPEQQDGRWKWLRFSAAASPGNSGGPLLDREGAIIGVIIGKSPNENLNYALPIGRVLDAPEDVAMIEQRYLQQLSNMNKTLSADFNATLPLPASFSDFASRYVTTSAAENARSLDKLLETYRDDVFPRGQGAAQLLGSVLDDDFPRIIGHDENGRWVAEEPDDMVTIELPEDGHIAAANQYDVTTFRYRAPSGTSTAISARQLAEEILKVRTMARPVGSDWVRITSLGEPERESQLTDNFGRQWAVMAWPLGYMDALIVVAALPLPDGYAGMAQTVLSSRYLSDLNIIRLLADFVHLSYSGTLPQWQSFLADRTRRPVAFESLGIAASDDRGVEIETPRFSLQVPPDVLQLGPGGVIDLLMTYVVDDGALNWGVGGAIVRQDEASSVSVYRKVRPASDVGSEQKEWWRKMTMREAPFDMRPMPDAATRTVSMRVAVAPHSTGDLLQAVENSEVLYDVSYSTKWRSLMPWDMEHRFRTTLRYLTVLEDVGP